MRFFVDTNILLYAINRDCPEHARAARALDGWLNGPTHWCMGWNVLYEFLRLATHPRVFARPLSSDEAIRVVRTLTACETLRILVPGEKHQALLEQTVAETGRITGNLFHDLHSAVLMREHGVSEIMTADAYFRRFDFLTVTDPTRP